MKRYALALIPTLAATAAFAQTGSEKITLQYVRPSDMITALRENGTQQAELHLLKGISSLKADDSTNSLNVTGRPEAIANLKKVIVLLDVYPRQVLIKLKLVRVMVSGNGVPLEEVQQSPIISTTNNRPGIIGVTGGDQFTVRVVPHINGDDTVALFVSSSLAVKDRNNRLQQFKNQTTRRIDQNQNVRLYGFSDNSNRQVQDALRQGKLADLPGIAYTAYFIEASAWEQKNSAPAAPPQP